ncbi:MAG TPA: HEAT repeat domain-containing protein [Pyrinomonadaceae bacterium]|jgi:HEAT repeat protein
MPELKLRNRRSVRISLALAGVTAGLWLWPAVTPQAQRGANEQPVNVTGVSARPRGGDAVVSISGDGALNRAQTWQDDEGFHVVVYKGQSALKTGLPRGVKARRVGDSLELVVPVKSGGRVYVQPGANQLDLVVGGGLQTGGDASARTHQSAHAAQEEESAPERATTTSTREENKRQQQANATLAAQPKVSAQLKAAEVKAQAHAQPAQAGAAQTQVGAQSQVNSAQSQSSNAPSQGGGAASGQPAQANAGQSQGDAQPAQDAAQTTQPPAPSQPMKLEAQAAGGSLLLPLSVLGACGGGGLVAFLFVYRRRRKTDEEDWAEESEPTTALTRPAPVALSKTDAPSETAAQSAQRLETNAQGERRRGERRTNWGRRAEDKLKGGAQQAPPPVPEKTEKHERRPVGFQHVPAVIFGAYRIDQEVEKLIQGQPHSIEVLASRATDDRRAVETSLVKALQSNMLAEDERRRARAALEEYGFVARQSATLLLANDAYDRTMAARVLGQIRSASALPFLLEALHDPEPVVCTEVVSSLGALGLPAAIGALLDLARRHPEMPTPLLGRALSACSVDCIEVDGATGEARLLTAGAFTGDLDMLEPVAEIEQLPEWLEDQTLTEALTRLGSTDVEARVAAAQQLAQFQVQRSVAALSALAADDPDATVRATAVTSLGIIGHESVFAAVLIGMADEAREVRAAAARALSRLSFDRADAYVRVIESGDEELCRRVAQACISSGLAAKALDRLASEDRRQAYEAFSLLSLVVRAGALEVIYAAVERPGELSVRLAAARLLALQGQPEINARLRRVALGDGAPEKLRQAILEAIYRDDHAAVD